MEEQRKPSVTEKKKRIYTPEEKARILARRKAIAEAKKRKKRRKRLITLGIILGVLLILGGLGFYEYKKISNPASLFNTMGQATAAPASPTAEPAAMGEQKLTADPDEEPYDDEDFDENDLDEDGIPDDAETDDENAVDLVPVGNEADTDKALTGEDEDVDDPDESDADKAASGVAESAALFDPATAAGTGDNIFNVLLIGVDYAEERLTDAWLEEGGSTAEHADVMIVLAINLTKNRVDMISLPRDTYAHIPGVKGLYKLNASLDCGGGLFRKDENGTWIKDANGQYVLNEAGFEKVMESCEWMLGGSIPIDYYYAVTMPAVKQLVDAIGGVDYDLDVTFSMQGRNYQPGRQHMNGQAVLDYLRVRKSGTGLKADETGDGARVGRQKDMLVAILNQLREQNMLLKVPEILRSFSGQLFTNCSFEQTMALAKCGLGIDPKNIRMWSMDGIWSSKKSAKLNFCFTDQEKRVSIIKEVYGIEVEEYKDCTMAYAYFLWNDLQAERYITTCSGLKKHLNGSNKGFTSAYNKVRKLKKNAEDAAEKYLSGYSNFLNEPTEKLEAALEDLRYTAISAKSSSGYKKSLDFYSTLKRYNEIEVDPS